MVLVAGIASVSGAFVIGAVVGAAVVLLFTALTMQSANPAAEHYHDWEVRGAMKLYNCNTTYGVRLMPVEDGEPITEVLYRCSTCQEVTTETLDGHWTVEQLTKEEVPEVAAEPLKDSVDEQTQVSS